jgi:hypothetical protein
MYSISCLYKDGDGVEVDRFIHMGCCGGPLDKPRAFAQAADELWRRSVVRAIRIHGIRQPKLPKVECLTIGARLSATEPALPEVASRLVSVI